MSATLTALPQVGFPVRVHRWLKLLAHLGRGLATVSFRFPAWDMAQRAAVSQQWSAQLLTIMGIEVKLLGQPPGLYPANTFLIANHVSWLDIFALNSVTVSRFVAKREIRQWPVIGMLVARAGTLFIDRSNRRDALRVNEILASSLREGDCMAVFPRELPQMVRRYCRLRLRCLTRLFKQAAQCNLLGYVIAVVMALWCPKLPMSVR